MSISDKRAAEIKAFHNTDFSDCPELTDEQLARLKPSHYRNMTKINSDKKPQKALLGYNIFHSKVISDEME